MKKCPYCAEEIQDEAIFCRYCHSDLKPIGETKNKSDIQNTTREKTPSTFIFGKSAQIAAIITVVGAIGLIFRYQNAPIELIGSLTIGTVANFLFWWFIVSFFRNELPKPIMVIALILVGLGGLFALFLILVGINNPASTPSPTFIPTEVRTIRPTNNPLPTEHRACTLASNVTSDMQGSTICVYGIINRTDTSEGNFNVSGATRIRFGDSSIFFITLSGYYTLNKGDCVFTQGEIQLSSERVPYIKDTPVYACESWMK